MAGAGLGRSEFGHPGWRWPCFGHPCRGCLTYAFDRSRPHLGPTCQARSSDPGHLPPYAPRSVFGHQDFGLARFASHLDAEWDGPAAFGVGGRSMHRHFWSPPESICKFSHMPMVETYSPGFVLVLFITNDSLTGLLEVIRKRPQPGDIDCMFLLPCLLLLLMVLVLSIKHVS